MTQHTAIDPLLPTNMIHQFPLPTWIENLAVRSNGQMLYTVITAPELWLVDADKPSNTRLVHRFDGTSGLSGIVQVEDDIFYVAGGRFNLQTFQTEAGSFKLWRVDMKDFEKDGKASVNIAVELKDMRLPNGLGLVSKVEKIILAADSEVGAIFKIDIEQGKHEVLIDTAETRNAEQAMPPIAANGIKVHDGYAYWSNSSKALLSRMKIESSGQVLGAAEVLEQGFVADDFCFDAMGNLWFTQNPLNTVAVRKAAGGIAVVAGNIGQMDVAGCTACHFDRRAGKEHILYVTTTGALGAPVNGSQVEGGKVVAVDTSVFDNSPSQSNVQALKSICFKAP